MATTSKTSEWMDNHPTAPIMQIERTYTEILVLGLSGSTLSVTEQKVLDILQWFQDEGILGATVRVTVPGGDDFTYKAAVPS